MILRNHHTDALLRWIERALRATGIACLAWSGAVSLQAVVHQREQRHALEEMLTAVRLSPVEATTRALERGALVGSLEVPRVGLSAVVLEGDDEPTLRVGIGHLPDTPLPWQHGNSALAGHRDTFFRALRGLRIGDHLSLTTLHGDLEYRVREVLVVDPADLWVLDPTDGPVLTLVTCYPFSYVGRAPQRYVVRADRL